MVFPKFSLLIKKILLLVVLVSFIAFILNTQNATLSSSVVLSFIALLFIAIRSLLASRVSYGLNIIFAVFILIFLVIAPLCQYLLGVTFWGANNFLDNNYLRTNIYLIISLLVYNFVYNITFRRYKIHENRFCKTISYRALLSISILASLYIVVIVYKGDINALLFRGDDTEGKGLGPMTLLNYFFFRPIPALCFLLYKFYNINNNKRLIEIILLLLMLITNCPIGIPRFVVAALYIPVAYCYCKFLFKPMNFSLFMIGAIIILFPLLNLVRSPGNLDISTSFFLTGNFDSYQSLMEVIRTNTITYGKQLLGCFFFFIPRSIWQSKPYGSGFFIAENEGYFFDNISMNYFGEGYINFGFAGVILFTILIARINGIVDKKYWNSNATPVFKMLFFVSIGMEFIIMRGALLNVMPVLVGYIIMTLTINKLAINKL